MHYRSAKRTDLPAIARLLSANGLQAAGCDQFIENFLLVELDDELVACGGFECHGAVGLLRSVAVDENHQGQGFAMSLLPKLESRACSLGLERLFLLTETAQRFFEKQGYRECEREMAPDAIQKTQQFSQLCPAEAQCMYRDLVSTTMDQQ